MDSMSCIENVVLAMYESSGDRWRIVMKTNRKHGLFGLWTMIRFPYIQIEIEFKIGLCRQVYDYMVKFTDFILHLNASIEGDFFIFCETCAQTCAP